ncbi:MAG TPA: universal stress protein [Pyrinomonadaceae bacterium]|jgi:nucleotide-binding universal stress UspA family protein
MTEKMKVLVAYDGSECADAVLDDLKRAGLPHTLEAVVLAAADVFIPPSEKDESGEATHYYVTPGIRRAHEHAARELEEARRLVETAGERLKTDFPAWEVRAEAHADSPAWAVIKRGDEWRPDLIVVGSQGHARLGGRLILGSVSQRVLYEARCSVRVARKPGTTDVNSPVRIVIGTDGSPDAGAAIEAVAARSWPNGSEARIISALDTVVAVTPDDSQPSAVKWLEGGDEEEADWLRQVFEPSAERLRSAGLDASVLLRKGNPKRVLVEEAAEWGADSIFVGAKGLRGIDRLLLGSVSAAVAGLAPCSVEVVRRPV